MTWALYRWVWRVESPLYIGAPPAGALNRTRLYIPARVLWGALTAELARKGSADFPDYANVGKRLQQGTRLSYLFPAEQIGTEWRAWLPRYREGEGLVWQREKDHQEMDDRAFRARLLFSRPGTAIAPESDTAEEATLREFDLINPYWKDRDASLRPVAMVGYLFCNDSDLCRQIQQIEELFVGGDIRYGLGCLRRIACDPACQFFGGVQVDLQRDCPVITTSGMLAHTRLDAHAGPAPIGAMEALGGWDMVQGEIKRPELFWTPGSSFQQDQNFKVQEDGLW